jgi:hypothetical protein
MGPCAAKVTMLSHLPANKCLGACVTTPCLQCLSWQAQLALEENQHDLRSAQLVLGITSMNCTCASSQTINLLAQLHLTFSKFVTRRQLQFQQHKPQLLPSVCPDQHSILCRLCRSQLQSWQSTPSVPTYLEHACRCGV